MFATKPAVQPDNCRGIINTDSAEDRNGGFPSPYSKFAEDCDAGRFLYKQGSFCHFHGKFIICPEIMWFNSVD